jgi:enoyl-CoA hydratase
MSINFTRLDAGIMHLEVNRPQVRNALDWRAMQAFAEAIETAHQQHGLRVLILSGRGPSFIAGGDLKALHGNNTRQDGERLAELMTRALARLEALPCPVIAAVNGPARGGGAEIALACDLRILEENADLGFVQVSLGLTPGWGGGQRLLRLAGYSQSLAWLSSGSILPARTAQQHGLANAVVPDGQSLTYALETARLIASQSAEAVQAVKSLLQAGLHLPADQAARHEQALFPPLWASEAHVQAVERYLLGREAG